MRIFKHKCAIRVAGFDEQVWQAEETSLRRLSEIRDAQQTSQGAVSFSVECPLLNDIDLFIARSPKR